MALAGTDRGVGTSNTATTSFTLSPSGNFAARSMAVLVVAADNGGSSGSHNLTGVTDSHGNTWTIRQSPLNDPGAASAGVQGVIATCNQNVALLTTSSVITVTFGNTSSAARAWTLQEITCAAGKLISYVTGGVSGAFTTNPTVTTGSITNGDAVVGGCFIEYGTAQVITGDGDSTNGSWSTHQTTSIGTTTSGMAVSSQRKIVSATATQTYNPTYATTADSILAWVQLRELNAYVLTADAGAYTLAMTAAGLRQSWLLTAASYSAALSLTAATLLRGRLLTADVGAYTLTMTAAALQHGWLLTAASYSAGLSLTAAALLHGQLLAAEVGTYTLVGQDATLTKSSTNHYTLTADALSLTLSLTAAGLYVGRVLGAVNGSMTFAGQAASLLFGRKLTGVSGAYALSLTSALLLHDRRLSADTLIIMLAGQDANLSRGRVLSANGGEFFLTGEGASLLRTYKLAVNNGVFDLTGQDIALLHGQRLGLDSGAFAIVGIDADLIYDSSPGAYTLVANSGTFAFTYFDSTLTYTSLYIPVARPNIAPGIYPFSMTTLQACDDELLRLQLAMNDRIAMRAPGAGRAVYEMRNLTTLRKRELLRAGVTY